MPRCVGGVRTFRILLHVSCAVAYRLRGVVCEGLGGGVAVVGDVLSRSELHLIRRYMNLMESCSADTDQGGVCEEAARNGETIACVVQVRCPKHRVQLIEAEGEKGPACLPA